MMTATFDDPLASASQQFPLVAPQDVPPAPDIPSPIGLRPWGLRTLTVGAPVSTAKWEGVHYDHGLQMAVDRVGNPVITMGPPSADTTATVDGEDGPSSEDWINDFAPDEPYQV